MTGEVEEMDDGNQDDLVKSYLQRAHDLGGGWPMALNMMAAEIIRLRDLGVGWRLQEAARPEGSASNTHMLAGHTADDLRATGKREK